MIDSQTQLTEAQLNSPDMRLISELRMKVDLAGTEEERDRLWDEIETILRGTHAVCAES